MKHKFSKADYEERKGLSPEIIELWEAVGVEKMPAKTKTRYDAKNAAKNAENGKS